MVADGQWLNGVEVSGTFKVVLIELCVTQPRHVDRWKLMCSVSHGQIIYTELFA